MDGREVFGRHADGITSQSYSGDPRWGTENIDNPSKLRQQPMRKAWHTHGNMPHERADFFHFEQESVRRQSAGNADSQEHSRQPCHWWESKSPHEEWPMFRKVMKA